LSTSTYPDPSLPRPPPVVETTTMISGGSHIHRRISWAAIFGGVILVVSVQLLLSLLGAGIGLNTVNVNAGTTPGAGNLGLGAGIWWVVSSIIALVFGGYAAAWLAGIELRWDGILHGLLTWGIATLLTVYLLSSAIGGVIGGGFSALGGAVSAAGSTVSAAAKPLAQATGITPDMLQQRAQAYLKPINPDPASMSPEDAQKEIVTNLATYAKGGPDAAPAKTRVVAIMAAQQHVPIEQATKQFDDAEARLKRETADAVQTAKTAADTTAAAASRASFGAFAALLIGAIAAAVGGSLAVQRRLHVAGRIIR